MKMTKDPRPETSGFTKTERERRWVLRAVNCPLNDMIDFADGSIERTAYMKTADPTEHPARKEE